LIKPLHILAFDRNGEPTSDCIETRQEMIKLGRGLGAQLIGVDTAARFAMIEEINNSHMTMLAQSGEHIATEVDCAFLFTHHFSQSASLNGQAGMSEAFRGGTGFVSACRWALGMQKLHVEEAKKRGIESDIERDRIIQLFDSKLNYSEKDEERWAFRQPAKLVTGVDNPYQGMLFRDDQQARRYPVKEVAKPRKGKGGGGGMG
jgi:RecA-family ATPase